MNAKAIEFFRTDGTPVMYRPLSDRIPEFLEKYGPEQGYAVVIEVRDWLELRPGLLALYQAAITSGLKPHDVGLPALDPVPVMVFTARLVDKEGKTVRTASARKPIQAYKDYEAGETAAHQRLLASLGFGGDVLDDDESADRKSMGLLQPPSIEKPEGEAQAPVAPLTAASVAEGSEQPGVIAPEAKAQPVETKMATVATVAVTEPVAAVAPATTGGSAQKPAGVRPAKIDPNGPPFEAIVSQIRHQASLRGIQVPELKTQSEARAYLAQMMKQPM